MGERVHLDLVREELAELVEGVIDPRSAQPFGVYVLPAREPAAELGRHVEREVFFEFFGNSPLLLAEEYGRYESASLFLCVIDHRRRLPAGTIRVILPSDAGFKSLDDIERVWGERLPDVLDRTGLTLDPQRVWDVATLAVTADYRGGATQGLVSLALYQALGVGALRCGIRWLVTVLDVVVLELIQSQTQSAFSFFHGVEPMRYLDSPSSVPVWCDLETWSRRVEVADHTVYELLCEGRGLEAAVAPPDWDAVAALVGAAASGARTTRVP